MSRTYYCTAEHVKNSVQTLDASLTDAMIEEFIRQAEGKIDAVMQETFRTVSDSGTATAGAVSTITDTAKTWTVNGYANYSVSIWSGTGLGQIRVIASNTATVLTLKDDWTTTPDATSKYEIFNFSEYKHNLIRKTAIKIASFDALNFDVSNFASNSAAALTADLVWASLSFLLEDLKNKRIIDYLKSL